MWINYLHSWHIYVCIYLSTPPHIAHHLVYVFYTYTASICNIETKELSTYSNKSVNTFISVHFIAWSMVALDTFSPVHS